MKPRVPLRARALTDIIISHQTLRKQTWRRAGNLKTKSRLESKRPVFKPVIEILTKNSRTIQRALFKKHDFTLKKDFWFYGWQI